MKQHLLISLVLLAALFTACNSQPIEQPESLIVEAWIDANGFPYVLIHKSYVLASAPDTITTLENIVENQLIPFGKVTISDGETQAILTGRLDTMYLPPYTYTTIDIEGQVGRTYTITVTYNDLYATATTTIPPAATLDSLSVTHEHAGTSSIHAYLSCPDSTQTAYYLLFTRKKGTKQYHLCPYGVFTSKEALNGILDMKVYNPYLLNNELQSISSQFLSTDSATYQLKVARVDYDSYCFWKAYNQQNLSQGIFFVPIYKNIQGNVNGGYGNFTGMGSNTYLFTPSEIKH